MASRMLKMLLMTALPLAAETGHLGAVPVRQLVVLQSETAPGKPTRWVLYQNGVPLDQAGTEYFKVPAGQDLVILSAGCTLRAAPAAAARAAHFHLSTRNGLWQFPLARWSARLMANTPVNSVTQAFPSGLLVPEGTELTGGLTELSPGAAAGTLELSCYGYLVPRAAAPIKGRPGRP